MTHHTTADQIERLRSRCRWHMARAADSRESKRWKYRLSHPTGPYPARNLHANSDVRIHLGYARAAREEIRALLAPDQPDPDEISRALAEQTAYNVATQVGHSTPTYRTAAARERDAGP